MRAEPNLFELCRAIATSTKSKECPKGLIAERWGVKSQVTLYQHIVEYQQQHSTSVFLLLSHYVTAPLRKRSTWLPFTVTTLIIKSISKCSSFCPKRSSAERWGVKSQVTLYQHIVEYQQHSTSVFLLLSHCVTVPLRKRSTQVLFSRCYIVEYQWCKYSAPLFVQRGAPRSGEELSPRLLFINISLNINNNTVQAFFYSSVTAWQLLFARGAPKFLFSRCYIFEYQRCKYSAPQSLRDSSS